MTCVRVSYHLVHLLDLVQVVGLDLLGDLSHAVSVVDFFLFELVEVTHVFVLLVEELLHRLSPHMLAVGLLLFEQFVVLRVIPDFFFGDHHRFAFDFIQLDLAQHGE